MAVAVTYPGVYIEEVPSGVRTITSVGTSITAFVDGFPEGPMNTPTPVFGMAEFTRRFGGLHADSEASYALAQFFLNGGSQALVVRCASGSFEDADVTIGDQTAPATDVLRLRAANPGAWGNTLRAVIDHRTSDPAARFNLTLTRHASADAGAAVVGSETFLDLTLDPDGPRFVEEVLEADSQLARAEALGGAGNLPAANGTTSGDLAAFAGFDALSGGELDIAVGAGATFHATMATWAAGTVTTLAQVASRLEAAIRTARDAVNVPPRPAPPALTGATVRVVSAAGGAARLAIRAGRDPAGELTDTIAIAAAGAVDAATPLRLLAGSDQLANVQAYPFGAPTAAAGALTAGTDGDDGDPPDADALVGAVANAGNQGIFALRRADLFNLLCLPRTAAIEAGTGGDAAMSQVVSQAITFCEQSRAFYLLDIPARINTVAEVKDWLDTHTFASRNAAVFFPRVLIPDPLNGFRARSVGPSGTMAGVFARTDSERGVWKAPAGIDAVLRGLVDMDMKLTDAENGLLNPLGINCLRTLPVYGSVAWGARTLDGADQRGSEWKYTPIRRLALMLEESLFRGTKWVVFEPNDEPLWARIRLNVGAYMMGLFRQGAFQGASPKEAFFVKCDAETTTQADRNLGIVNIHVGFAPLKPAEFVVIRIQQIAGDL
jgi:phage tail sheath protein FI